FSLIFGNHFKFRSAKFLYLKIVGEVVPIESLHRARRFKLQRRISEIHVLWKFECSVEPAEGIESQDTFRNLVVTLILNHIAQRFDCTVYRTNIAIAISAD